MLHVGLHINYVDIKIICEESGFIFLKAELFLNAYVHIFGVFLVFFIRIRTRFMKNAY